MADLVSRKECQDNHLSMTEKIDNLKDELKCEINNLKLSIATVPIRVDEKLDKMIEKLDRRYASKNTEKLVNGAVVIILATVITALIYLVIKTPK